MLTDRKSFLDCLPGMSLASWRAASPPTAPFVDITYGMVGFSGMFKDEVGGDDTELGIAEVELDVDGVARS